MVLDVENTMPCIQTSNLPSGRKCSFTEVNKHIKYVIRKLSGINTLYAKQ